MAETLTATANTETGDQGPLHQRICTTLPIADTAHAQQFMDDLVKAARGADDTPLCPALLALIDDEAVHGFLLGVMESSWFLRGLILRDPLRLERLLMSSPEASISRILSTMMNEAAAAEREADVMRVLRLAKQEAALVIALADLAGIWSVMQVTNALTRLADTALSCAIRFCLKDPIARGRFLAPDPTQPEVGSGLIVLAMGKYGAGELNYSSDIDLIIFYDPDIAPLTDKDEPSVFFVRLTKRLVKLMQDWTEHGYVFRTDLRLRPDPGATAVAVSVYAALQYYESMGQNWERAALIKARPCAGDIAAGTQFLKDIVPFVWRKYFDYAALADVHAMKRQIHAHKGFGKIAVKGHNVKLGRGGIREIEFFAQTQQLIAGGRNPDLRGRETLKVLDQLVVEGWIEANVRDDLHAAYAFLRQTEHRIQMLNDEQTHILPDTDDGIMRVVRLMGFADYQAFADALTGWMTMVQTHYANLFEDEPDLAVEGGNLVFAGDDDDPETLETLNAMGFRAVKDIVRQIKSWHFGRYPATRSSKARERLTELTPALLDTMAGTDNPDNAFFAFDTFLAGLPVGVQLFSLLKSNPNLLRLLVNIMGTAPRLSSLVARRPRVLDALLDPAFFGTLPTMEELSKHLEVSLAQANVYEDVLDRVRIVGQEQSFLIGARILSSTITARQAGEAFTDLAQLLAERCLQAATDVLTDAHGHMPGGRAAILAMGKLGGKEMSATSDLDMITLYRFDPDALESDGKRKISGNQYYTRLTQRFVSALSAPTAEGTLYEVDLRLRPSGRSGPLATHIDAFHSYQEKDAWTWEHMALTRARVIAGDADFAEQVNNEIRLILMQKRDAETIRTDVADMRVRLAKEKGSDNPWAIKQVPGGLIDLEFLAQYLQLIHAHEAPDILSPHTETALQNAAALGFLSANEGDILARACRLYSDMIQILRLCFDDGFDPQKASGGLKACLVRAAELPDFSRLEPMLRETQADVRAIFLAHVGPLPEEAG